MEPQGEHVQQQSQPQQEPQQEGFPLRIIWENLEETVILPFYPTSRAELLRIFLQHFHLGPPNGRTFYFTPVVRSRTGLWKKDGERITANTRGSVINTIFQRSPAVMVTEARRRPRNQREQALRRQPAPNEQLPAQQPNEQQPEQQPNEQQPEQQPNEQQPEQQPNEQQPAHEPAQEVQQRAVGLFTPVWNAKAVHLKNSWPQLPALYTNLWVVLNYHQLQDFPIPDAPDVIPHKLGTIIRDINQAGQPKQKKLKLYVDERDYDRVNEFAQTQRRNHERLEGVREME